MKQPDELFRNLSLTLCPALIGQISPCRHGLLATDLYLDTALCLQCGRRVTAADIISARWGGMQPILVDQKRLNSHAFSCVQADRSSQVNGLTLARSHRGCGSSVLWVSGPNRSGRTERWHVEARRGAASLVARRVRASDHPYGAEGIEDDSAQDPQ